MARAALTATSYAFQNPSDGIPMILRLCSKGYPVVDIDPVAEGEYGLSTIEDSREMSKSVRNCKDVHDAAEFLHREYRASDIFD